ncbi:RsmB/NOP family class I SAM-dependent RNA methyltransferase [Falsihalocynthiibacter sp. BN13B15]|uniref:RsmB/NOP family class I SAM-dependent RNA methyltransferase n=1 Tax=Falsihalocynthiibacter sp. BN13B15 TaxID=3240871 RepID=UPI00350F07E4
MTPGARVASAIEILDAVLAGDPAEKQLTTWARSNRYAGSKDRVAVRDLVFEALRCKQSFSVWGGEQTGRAILTGLFRAQGLDPQDVFTGEGYAPKPLSEEELAEGHAPQDHDALDVPEWLAPQLQADLGEDFAPVLTLLQSRAPVFLRVNLQATTRDAAIAALAAEEIVAKAHDLSPSALLVTKNPRRVQNSKVFAEGYVELQDAASQFVTDQIPLKNGARILDYCAGGGGKSLALAARMPKGAVSLFAHDISHLRMRDVPVRAERAGVEVTVLETVEVAQNAPYDVVVCDVPCSGSGAWRRAPDGKWALTQERLDELTSIQAEILAKTKEYVAKSGVLAFLTCSLLRAENEAQVEAFLVANSDWRCMSQERLTPLAGGDGFFVAILKRA